MTADDADVSGTAAARSGSTSSGRTRSYAFGLLALGGLGGLISAGRPWWVGAAEGSNVTFSGTETTGGLAQAVPFVLLAGTLLALALRARGRRVVGLLLAATGVGGVVGGVLRPVPPRELVLNRLQAVTLGDTYQLAPTAWSYVSATAALLAVAGGVLMLVHARRWPTRAARFERTAAGEPTPAATPEASEAALWTALDAGVDPTDDAGPVPTGPRPSVPDDGGADATDDSTSQGDAGATPAPIRTSTTVGDTMGASASRSTPAGSSRSGQATGADPPAAPAAETAGLDTEATRATGPRRPGSEGETA